jgi:DNA adenine methylase
MKLMSDNDLLHSPFRYPGGKSWLAPEVSRWVTQHVTSAVTFCEPFAGGASVGLAILFEQLCDRLVLVEKDVQVAAVWQTILSDDVDWLCERITGFELSAATVDQELARRSQATRELAFRTILKNRVNRGGIIARRAGMLKDGENGRGIASRWYPGTLCRRIRTIHDRRSQIQIILGDGLQLMEHHASDTDTLWFIDPPYTAGGTNPGNRLYTHSEIDHDRLFKLIVSLTGDYLVTYSDSDEARELARWHRLKVCEIRMKTTHHRDSTELLIGKDLDWVASRVALI